MKTTVTLAVLALTAALPARAQLFRPETVTGAVIGGVAGAVIGHNDDRHGWEGAAYGAAAGALVGTVVGQSREHSEWRGTQVTTPVYRGPRYVGRPVHVVPVPRYAYGYGHGYPHRRPTLVYVPSYRRPPVYVVRPGPDYVVRRPSYAGTGALLGGIAGAIIGHNDDRHGWEGAAIGAGAGYILGSIADQNARNADYVESHPSTPVQTAAPASSAPQQVTIINNYYGTSSTPMSAANGLFGR